MPQYSNIIIIRYLPYNINHPEATVVIWFDLALYKKKVKLSWIRTLTVCQPKFLTIHDVIWCFFVLLFFNCVFYFILMHFLYSSVQHFRQWFSVGLAWHPLKSHKKLKVTFCYDPRFIWVHKYCDIVCVADLFRFYSSSFPLQLLLIVEV